MKTKLITILLCLFPLLAYAQNYEQQGDELFAQSQYEKAIKKYNAAIELGSASSQISKKIQTSKKCVSLSNAAINAENKNVYSKALDLYTQLYELNNIPLYKEKIALCRRKIKEAEQTRVQRETEESKGFVQAKRSEQEKEAAEKYIPYGTKTINRGGITLTKMSAQQIRHELYGKYYVDRPRDDMWYDAANETLGFIVDDSGIQLVNDFVQMVYPPKGSGNINGAVTESALFYNGKWYKYTDNGDAIYLFSECERDITIMKFVNTKWVGNDVLHKEAAPRGSGIILKRTRTGIWYYMAKGVNEPFRKLSQADIETERTRLKAEQERKEQLRRQEEQERIRKEEQAKREKEKKNWEAACKANTVEAYQNYINNGGKDVSLAYAKIDLLYWKQACESDEIGAYKEYLTRNTKTPKKHVEDAQKRIDVIKKQSVIITDAELIKDKQKAFEKVQEARKLGKIHPAIQQRALIIEEPHAYKKAKSKDATSYDVELYLRTYYNVAPDKHISEIKEKQKKYQTKLSRHYQVNGTPRNSGSVDGYRKMGDVSINTAVNIQTIRIYKNNPPTKTYTISMTRKDPSRGMQTYKIHVGKRHIECLYWEFNGDAIASAFPNSLAGRETNEYIEFHLYGDVCKIKKFPSELSDCVYYR